MPVVVVHQSERVVGVFGREAERVRFGNVERREGRVGGRGGHRAERCVLVVRRDSSCLLERDDVGDVLVPVVRIEEVPSALALQDERTRRHRLRRIPCDNETEGLPKSLTANGKEGQTLIPIPNGKTGLTFFPIRDGARMARNRCSASCHFPVSLCSHRHVVNALFTDSRDPASEFIFLSAWGCFPGYIQNKTLSPMHHMETGKHTHSGCLYRKSLWRTSFPIHYTLCQARTAQL